MSIDNNFRQEALKVRSEPSEASWKRLEAKLDTSAAERKVRRMRVFNIAASFLLIAGLATAAIYFASETKQYESEIYSVNLNALDTEPPSESTIYNVEKVKRLNAIVAKQ